MEIVIYIILGAILGGAVMTFILLKRQHQIDDTELQILLDAQKQVQTEIDSLTDQKEFLLVEMEEIRLTSQMKMREYENRRLREIDDLAQKAIAAFEDQREQWKQECNSEYLIILEECAQEFANQTQLKKEELAILQQELQKYQSLINSAVEANRREAEKIQKQDFYKLKLSVNDLEEIAKLRQVSLVLRDTEPLNKVIWKVYYEKPTTDLIGRVIGPGTHTGIYKITNLQNQMCYVGQAANLADRWKQHIKRGLGAEPLTKNKLYPAMQEYGVENFSFEVIEECERSQLNEREDYWQEYFHAIDFGYSIK